MSIRSVLFGGLLGGLVMWLGLEGIHAQQPPQESVGSQIQQLLTEKRDALRERLEFLRSRYASGVEPYESLLRAEDLVLQAELELAPTAVRRREIGRQRVELFRKLEDRVATDVKNGAATLDTRLLVTAQRVQAEIDLVRDESRP